MFTFINLHPLRRPLSTKKKKGWSHLPCRVKNKKGSDFTDSSAIEVGEMLLLWLCHRTRLGSRCQVSGQQQQQRVSTIAHTQQQQFHSGFPSAGFSFPLGSRSYQMSSQRDLDPAQFSLKISWHAAFEILHP